MRENVIICDPFCGSGTFPIEAAMMMTNRAPGLNRSFASEKFEFLDESIWDKARQEANDVIIFNSQFEAFASDIDDKCISLTKSNAKRANVFKYIKAFKKNALDIEKIDRRATVICNPPDGERI